MKRRRFLAGTAAAGSLPLVGGCVARSPGTASNGSSAGGPNEDGDEDGGESGTEPTNGADDAPSLSDSKGPVRGESDADVGAEVVEDDANVDYLPADDAVRYVTGWRHTNPEEVEAGEKPEREPTYDTTPFDQWSERQCISAAAAAAADHVSDELGIDGVGGGMTSTVSGADVAAYVSVETLLDRDGDVISAAPVEFDALVAATPASVTATYRLDGRERELDAPVYARYTVLQQE